MDVTSFLEYCWSVHRYDSKEITFLSKSKSSAYWSDSITRRHRSLRPYGRSLPSGDLAGALLVETSFLTFSVAGFEGSHLFVFQNQEAGFYKIHNILSEHKKFVMTTALKQ